MKMLKKMFVLSVLSAGLYKPAFGLTGTFDDLNQWFREVDELHAKRISDFWGAPPEPSKGRESDTSTDVPQVFQITSETFDDKERNLYIVKVTMPGAAKDQIKLRIDKQMLDISVTHAEKTKQQKDGLRVKALRNAAFKQRHRLPDYVDADSFDSDNTKFENGVLTLEFALKEKQAENSSGREVKLK